MLGIDVSKHNGLIDWKKAKDQIEFAIIRAGYSHTIDPKAERNIFYCERYNIPFGLYWFSYAHDEKEAIKEATTLLEFIGDRKIPLPLYFDFEYESDNYLKNKKGITLSEEERTKIAVAFCSAIESAGFYAGIYANLDYVNNYFDKDVFKRYALWLASWSKSLPLVVDLWQFTNKGKIKGITGDVDMNILYTDVTKAIKSKGLNNFNKKCAFCE